MLNFIIDDNLIEKVRVEVATKVILTVLAFLLTGFSALIFTMVSSHEPAFLHKIWRTIDGDIILYGKCLEEIELNGMPEGAMKIVFHEWDKERNTYKGVIYCQDHGGIIGNAILNLEPGNQIHLICNSELDKKYKIDLLFKTIWIGS